MNLYLIEGEVVYTPYMGFAEDVKNTNRIVLASSFEEACEKYEKYWTDQNKEYSHDYRVLTITGSEAIQ